MNPAIQAFIDSTKATIQYLQDQLEEAYRLAPRIPEDAKVGGLLLSGQNPMFDVSTFDEAAVLMRALGRGVWKKDVMVNYEGKPKTTYRREIEGKYHYITMSELPGTCRIEYSEVEVPATTKRVAKIVCDGGKGESE